jgi:hypothetical protein
MDTLRRFQGDTATREALVEFIMASIEREALHRMYAGEDVSHIKDAKALLDKAFEELDNLYEVKQRPHEPTNEAK